MGSFALPSVASMTAWTAANPVSFASGSLSVGRPSVSAGSCVDLRDRFGIPHGRTTVSRSARAGLLKLRHYLAPRNVAPVLHSVRELEIRDPQARRDPDSPLVFHRDGIPVRRWRTAWRTACQSAGVPTRFLHDCRRTAARNLIRANVPERVAMLLTGHKSRAIFDRYNIIHEQELLDAGDQLVAYLAQQAQVGPARRRPA